MTTQTTTRAGLMTAALLVTAGSAFAGIPTPMPTGMHSSSRVVQVHDGAGFSFDSGDLLGSAVVGESNSFAARTFAGATVSADSIAQYGMLTNDLFFAGPVQADAGDTRRIEGYTETGFEDGSLFLTSPGRGIGDTVQLDASFILDIQPELLFTEARTGSGFGFLSFSYDFVLEIAGNAFTYAGTFRNYGDGQTLFNGEATPGLVNITVDVPVGEVFSISARLNSQVRARANGVDFAGTFDNDSPTAHFTWAGFGAAPNGGELTSDNHNWNSVVPTPATGAIGVMAIALGVTRRRR